MRWDWYQATVETEPDHVIAELLRAHELASISDCPPIRPYERGVAIVRGDRTLARCFWGGVNPKPHVIATGEDSPAVAEVLRGGIPHRVSRADACEDYEAAGAWERISGMWLDAADEFGVSVKHEGDFHRGTNGRTLYLGAPTSVVRARCYEKGVQLGIDRPIVRAEVQCRPKSHARALVSKLEPGEAWGLSRWSRSLGEALTGLDIPRVPAGTLYTPTDTDRARAALLRQYGKHLQAWADELGSWEKLGSAIGDRLS